MLLNQRKHVIEHSQKLVKILVEFKAGLAEACARLGHACENLPTPKHQLQGLLWFCILDAAAASCEYIEVLSKDPSASKQFCLSIKQWLCPSERLIASKVGDVADGERFQRAFWRLAERNRWEHLFKYFIAYGPPPFDPNIRVLSTTKYARDVLCQLTYKSLDAQGNSIHHPPTTADIFLNFAERTKRIKNQLLEAAIGNSKRIPVRTHEIDFGGHTYLEQPICFDCKTELPVVEENSSLPTVVSGCRRAYDGSLQCQTCAEWDFICAEVARRFVLYTTRRQTTLGRKSNCV